MRWCTTHWAAIRPSDPIKNLCPIYAWEAEYSGDSLPCDLRDGFVVERGPDGEWPEWVLRALSDPPLYELSPSAQRGLGMDGEAVKVKPRFILDALAEAAGEVRP